MTDPARRWRIADGPVQWRLWGDEAVVHHDATATTHLLDRTACEMVLALRDARHAIDLETIWHRLSGAGAPDHNQRLMLEEALQRLAQVGLVVAVDP